MVQEALLLLAEQTDSLDFPNQKGKKLILLMLLPHCFLEMILIPFRINISSSRISKRWMMDLLTVESLDRIQCSLNSAAFLITE